MSQFAGEEDARPRWEHVDVEQLVLVLVASQGPVSQLTAVRVCVVPVLFRLSHGQRHEAGVLQL